MRTGTVTLEIGLMIKRTEEGLTNIWMEPTIVGIGKRTSNMGTELKPGQMQPNMKEITSMAKSTGLEPSNGRMDPLTSENSITIIFMEKAFTHGLIIGNMRVNGVQIKCTGKEHLHGPILENTLENMQKIKRKDMENSSGLTVAVTGENG